ncbi:hypothetical protein [Gorillibacterium sp. CAU 1737]|uniref:hypothetical protein n=1 Tax=Gorillibacterium sp. CAU 1737 TaxID=3140362 RepID=UPI00326055B3
MDYEKEFRQISAGGRPYMARIVYIGYVRAALRGSKSDADKLQEIAEIDRAYASVFELEIP